MTVLPRIAVGGKSKKSQGGIVEAFVVDGNGVPRGKWLPAEKLSDVSDKGLLIPRSVFAQDIWGRDADEAGLAHGTGDPDGLCRPVEGSVLPISWLSRRATAGHAAHGRDRRLALFRRSAHGAGGGCWRSSRRRG